MSMVSEQAAFLLDMCKLIQYATEIKVRAERRCGGDQRDAHGQR